MFTPHYTASFLVDELRPFPAVFGPLIEAQIPLLPNKDNTQAFSSHRSDTDCNITTCQTWKDAGKGIREVFDKLTEDIDLRENTRVREVEVLANGKKRVHDEYDNAMDVDRVVFACPANAVGNIYKRAGWLANTIFSTLVYADDHHPDSGHMHSVLHSDGSVIEAPYRDQCLKRASNYVEVTEKTDGTINIENQYVSTGQQLVYIYLTLLSSWTHIIFTYSFFIVHTAWCRTLVYKLLDLEYMTSLWMKSQ